MLLFCESFLSVCLFLKFYEKGSLVDRTSVAQRKFPFLKPKGAESLLSEMENFSLHLLYSIKIFIIIFYIYQLC